MLIVELPKDRASAGRIALTDDDGNRLAGPYAAYGKADASAASLRGNKTRNPLLLFGDTPCGEYKVVIAVPTGSGTPFDERIHGAVGALILQATAGDALLAAANGRYGLMIHGTGANGALRATNGCIRMYDNDLAALLRRISQTSIRARSLTCKVIETDIVLDTLVQPDCAELGGDPPLGIHAFIPNPDPSRRALFKQIAAVGVGFSVAQVIPHPPPPPPPPRPLPAPQPPHNRMPRPPHYRTPPHSRS